MPVVACAGWSRLPARGGCFKLSDVRQRVLRLPARACVRTACIRPAGACCAMSGSVLLCLPECSGRCDAFYISRCRCVGRVVRLSSLRAGDLYLRMPGSTVGVHYPFGDMVLRPVSAKKHLSVLRGFRVYREVLNA